jgi:hypothetical protein
VSSLPPPHTPRSRSVPTRCRRRPRPPTSHAARGSDRVLRPSPRRPAWMEKYRVWREQVIASSSSSKRWRLNKEAIVSAEELSTAVERLSLGQGAVIGSSQGSDEVVCPASKKNARNLSVRTCLTVHLHELCNEVHSFCIIAAS